MSAVSLMRLAISRGVIFPRPLGPSLPRRSLCVADMEVLSFSVLVSFPFAIRSVTRLLALFFGLLLGRGGICGRVLLSHGLLVFFQFDKQIGAMQRVFKRVRLV